jgi:outer membrane immunogenic protein
MFSKLVLSSAAILAVAGSAFAADLPSRRAPPVYIPPIPIFTWTGVYIGGQVGYDFGRDSARINSFGGTAGYGVSQNGVIGGAHVGYNQQYNQFVFGLEGDVDATSANKTFVPGAGVAFTERNQVEGSIRGRVGVAFDRVLVYGTGGAAFGGIKHTYATPFGFDSISNTRVGWTVGGGLEYAITNNWSVRAEYRYTDFGRANDNPINSFGVPGLFVRHHVTENRVQAGFSYKFDTFAPLAGPVVAKY